MPTDRHSSRLLNHMAAAFLTVLVGCNSKQDAKVPPKEFTSDGTPELGHTYFSKNCHFLREWGGNFIYLMADAGGRYFHTSDAGNVLLVDSYSITENSYVFFRDPKRNNFAIVDMLEVDIRKLDPSTLEFNSAPAESIISKSFSLARNIPASATRRKGQNAEWVYVDIQPNEMGFPEEFYITPKMNTSREIPYEYLRVLSTTTQRMSLTINKTSRTCETQLWTLLLSPVGGPVTRVYGKEDFINAIWAAYDSGKLK